MAIFKEVVRGDGSGIAEYYRVQDGRVMNVDYSMVTNKPTLNGVTLAGDLTTEDFGMNIEGAIETMTGEEISRLGKDDNKIVLCTSDYSYTDDRRSVITTTRGTVYEIVKGYIVDTIMVAGGSGGGGGSAPRTNLTTTISPLEINASVNSDVELKFNYETGAIPGTGSAKLYVNGNLKSTMSIEEGEYSFNVSKYIRNGVNYFSIVTTDRNDSKVTLDYIVNAIQLGISSSFNPYRVHDLDFDFTYTLTGPGLKTVHFIIDGEEFTEENTSNNSATVKSFTGFTHGQHTLSVYATCESTEGLLTSNRLDYTILTADPESSEILMLSTFNVTECTEGDLLSIDYMIYNPAAPRTTAQLEINGEVISTIEVDRTRQIWNVMDYPVGETTFSVVVGENRIDKTVTVSKLSIDIKEATGRLELFLSAANRSNQELPEARETWENNGISAELENFNWVSDGWIDGSLRFKGTSTGFIPLYLFSDDARETGKTIEVEFTARSSFSTDSLLLSCFTEKKGFEIYQTYATLNSEQTSISARYGENQRMRVAFVIESVATNRLLKLYINGVLSGLVQYSADDNFQHNNPVGITINPNQEEIDIHTIRVYSRELSSQEVLDNYIYDMRSNAEKIAKYTSNLIYDDYGAVSYVKMKAKMPVLTIVGTLPKSKGDKQTVSCVYENVQNTTYDFDYDGCIIDVQGTSSQYYPRKNWKITLPEKIKFHDKAIEEDTFCFKADYMETSHSHNIGTAILANDLPEELFPTRQENELVRDTMYGFPCVIFHKEDPEAQPVFYGTFMFNNDKSDNQTLGLTTESSESWEFKNNTSDHCLFKTNDFSPEAKPEDNLEARYPDKNTDYTNIKKLYDWVASCRDDVAKFKNEFNEHFNLHYCLNYIVLMEFAMLTDSRAKNMFLDTVDGNIWYPRFYDMDTCWGLNNEGWLIFGYDVEIHDKHGDGYVWNDRGESVFWNLFETAFADEIKTRYGELRKNHLTYDNLVKIYIEDISSKFVEASYNEDAYFKYVLPLIETADNTYLYAAQGNRISHFKYLLENRIKYLDSKYEYGDYNASYATMRLYCDTATFAITPHTTGYLKVRFGSSDVRSRGKARETVQIKSPTGLEFNDTETIVYGAYSIASLGDLSAMKPGTVDVTKCGKLQDLIIGPKSGSNTNLKTLSLGSNPLLRKLDVRNCPNLTGNLDMSGCTDLREVYLTGSGVTSVTLPSTSSVQVLHLPASLTNLTLKKQNNLADLTFESYTNIQTLIISDSKLKTSVEDLIFSCPNLQRLNVECGPGFLEEMPMDQLMYYTNNLGGVDDDGFNTDYPGFTGTMTVTVGGHLLPEEVAEYKELFATAYPLLDIIYEDGPALFTYTPRWSYGGDQTIGYGTAGKEIGYTVQLNGGVAPAVVTIPSSYKDKPIIGYGAPSTNHIYTLGSGNTQYLSSDSIVSLIDNNDYRQILGELGLSEEKDLPYMIISSGSSVKKLKNINAKWNVLYMEITESPTFTYEDASKITRIQDFKAPNGQYFFPNLTKITGTKLSDGIFKDVVWNKLVQGYVKSLSKNFSYLNYLQGVIIDPSKNYDETTQRTLVTETKYDIVLANEVVQTLLGYDKTDSKSPYYFYYNTGFQDSTKPYVGLSSDGYMGGCYYKGNVHIDKLIPTKYVQQNIIADSFTGLEEVTLELIPIERKNGTTIGGLLGFPTIYHTDYKKPMVFNNITNLDYHISSEFTIYKSGMTTYPLNWKCGPVISLPNLKKISLEVLYLLYSNPAIPIGNIYSSTSDYIKEWRKTEEGNKFMDWFEQEANLLLLPDGVTLTNTPTGTDTRSLLHTLSLLHQNVFRGNQSFNFDCSQITYGGSTSAPGSGITASPEVIGFFDYGKAFDPSVAANNARYKLGTFANWATLSEQSMINILDSLYDIASAGCATQTVQFGSTLLNKLRAYEGGQDAIDRATAKGWTIT